MPRASRIIASVLLLGLGACAGPSGAPAPAGPVAISPQTQGEIGAYLRRVKVTRPGAFAVSPDGLNSFYTWCDDTICATSSYSAPALRGCQALSGAPCLVLYVRHEPRLPYSVNGAAGDGRHGAQEQPRIDYDVRDR